MSHILHDGQFHILHNFTSYLSYTMYVEQTKDKYFFAQIFLFSENFSIPQQPLLTTCKNFLNFPRKLKYYFGNIFLKSPPLRAQRSQYRLDRIFWTLACEAFRNIYLSLRHKLEKEKFCILFEKFDNFLNKYIFGILILTFEYQ